MLRCGLCWSVHSINPVSTGRCKLLPSLTTRIISPRRCIFIDASAQKKVDSGNDTARLFSKVSPLASGACFGNETGETGTRCAISDDRNASAAPATVSQCGYITVNHRFTGHCAMTWRPTGRARMAWEGDVANLASPETGLLHSCCTRNRHSVCNGSSAGLRMVTAVRRPRVGAGHLYACRRSSLRI